MSQRMILTALLLILIAPMTHPSAEEVPYGTGTWDADLFGNHRAVVQVSKSADAVWVHIPWRRRDYNPEKKDIIIIDAKTNRRINNVCRVEINREFGDLVFQPQTVPGKYYVYYLLYEVSGRSNYPTVTYPEPEQTAGAEWLQRHGLTPDLLTGKKKNIFPQAQVLEIQAIDEFNSFYPMEIIATSDEVNALLRKHPKSSYLLFPEDRKYPIRMTDDLPLRWIKKGPQTTFRGDAARGEFYAFQIGVFACGEAIEDIDVHFNGMKSAHTGTIIPDSAFSCFNTGGVDWTGRKFDKVCPIDKGKIQALWCGVQIPQDIPLGEYTGEVIVAPKGMEANVVKIVLNIKNEALEDAGDSEPWRHSRLRWIDSTIALDDKIVDPFTPMKVNGNIVSCLGRSVAIDNTGFPQSIQSLFAAEMTHLVGKGREILTAPINLMVKSTEDEIFAWEGGGVKIVKQAPGAITWESTSSAGSLMMDCHTRMEFDGYIDFKVTLSTAETMSVNDIRLEIPMRKDVARYMMGMGFKGGYRPIEYHWKWDPKHNQDSAWIGDVNAGLQCSFKDENYSRPLNTNFYLLKPLNMPPSWYNEGNGGCAFKETEEDTFLISSYSGPRTIGVGEELHFNFSLLLTPFKTLDTQGQWNTRFYHQFKPAKEIADTGANTINVHHANDINPYINYPFLCPKEMKKYIDEAHELGLKVKIYYTVRELSNRAPEMFALRSLGDEVLFYGPGGGFSWLQEHLGSRYIAAWFVPRLKDAAVINSGVSRWHNYYVEGLNWLVKNVGIDGLYIDDVAFDRTIMKRVRKILDRGCKGALIDLHSANQFNVRDGFANSANLYLEHFPYLNRIWFGEYFDYDASPDFWLVEMSGIPFGVMGEMLQDGGNPWRGMLYGMTARLPWSGDPTHIWKVWDDFGIQNSEMVGYWVPSCPVKTNHKDILATAYVKKDEVLISIASWAEEQVNIRLDIDWDALGVDAEKAMLLAPRIEDFQDSAIFIPTDEIPVEPGKGWLLILSELKY
ncbi:MAG: DUF6067 family protein [Candidatus Aminicenantes bacterium]|nr:DUF6067 family protein [Candidatus Aminicenantes bacterium]